MKAQSWPRQSWSLSPQNPTAMISRNSTDSRAGSDTDADESCPIQRGFVDVPDIDNLPDANEESPWTTSSLRENNTFIKEKALWVPLSLRRTTLLLFTLLFIVRLAVLATIWRVSSAEQGLRTVNPNNYYLWTYGPTAGKYEIRMAFKLTCAANAPQSLHCC